MDNVSFNQIVEAVKQYIFYNIGTRLRKEICYGCNNSTINSVDHSGSLGCVQYWRNMPDEVFVQIYERINNETVCQLMNMVVRHCNTTRNIFTQIDISLNEVKDYFCSDQLEWGFLHQLCHQFVCNANF